MKCKNNFKKLLSRFSINKEKAITLSLCTMLIFDLYIISFIVSAKPSTKMNRVPIDKSKLNNQLFPFEEFYPGITVLYVSKNEKANMAAYYFYWPIHKFFCYKNMYSFARDN